MFKILFSIQIYYIFLFFCFFLGLYPSCFHLIYGLYEYLGSYKVSILFLYPHWLFSVTFLCNVYTWPLPVCNQKPGGPDTQKMLYSNISSLYLRKRVPGNFGIYQCPVLEEKKRVQKEENERVSKCLFLFYHYKNKDILLYPRPIRSLTFGMHDCGFQLIFNLKASEKWSRNCWALNIIFQISSKFLALKLH